MSQPRLIPTNEPITTEFESFPTDLPPEQMSEVPLFPTSLPVKEEKKKPKPTATAIDPHLKKRRRNIYKKMYNEKETHMIDFQIHNATNRNKRYKVTMRF